MSLDMLGFGAICFGVGGLICARIGYRIGLDEGVQATVSYLERRQRAGRQL